MRDLRVLSKQESLGILRIPGTNRHSGAARRCRTKTSPHTSLLSLPLPALLLSLCSMSESLPSARGHFWALAVQLVPASPTLWSHFPPRLPRSSPAAKIPWLQNPHLEPPEQGGAAEDAEGERAKGKITDKEQNIHEMKALKGLEKAPGTLNCSASLLQIKKNSKRNSSSRKMSLEVKGFIVELKPTSKHCHSVLFRSDQTPGADGTEMFSTRCLLTAGVTGRNSNNNPLKPKLINKKNPQIIHFGQCWGY